MPQVLDRAISATPLARRVAAIKGVDLAKVQGTGPPGRIVVADLGARVVKPVAGSVIT